MSTINSEQPLKSSFSRRVWGWLSDRYRIEPKTFWDFPPEMPFFQLHSVRSSLTYIPSIFLILVLLITCCSWSQLRVDLSFEGFNYYFFQVLKFPLAFFALLISTHCHFCCQSSVGSGKRDNEAYTRAECFC